MILKKHFLFLLLMITGFAISYAQKKTTHKPRAKSIHDAAVNHKQIYNSSCIPMSVELVLKYNKKVLPDYYKLQNNWKEKTDGTFNNFDGKTIEGIQFKHQFNLKRGDSFPFNQLFKTIDAELTAGRKVIISLPSGYNFWHMYVIDGKADSGDYIAYSRYFNDNNLITMQNIKKLIFEVKGTDILTYRILN
ncbi:hypothetical protein [Pedobacter metabolipauper]|uniref:Peptidase C39-like protein n=1 Tax=Pedobacter metabolipauper TaxID=425513 RepID=A0A4R6T042_9SPHI|nr:hypothetical protein [Pedobacter metabolipauper]TDQ11752.1 hypothetical protein ATK78_0880 [Pedobacter metabolipauper]